MKIINQLLTATNIVLYLLVIFLWLVMPDQKTLNLSVTIFSLSLTTLLILKNKEKFQSFVTSFKFKKLVENGIFFFLLFCILGLLNFLGNKYPKQLDLTKGRINTLAHQSVKLAKKIDENTVFKVFATKDKAVGITALLELYRLENPKISIEIVNPDLNPGQVAKYNIKKFGTVIIEKGDEKVSFNDYNEKTISNSLIKLIRNIRPILFIPLSHKDRWTSDNGEKGLTRLSAYLKARGVELNFVDLLGNGQMANENSILALIGPEDGFHEKEVESIEKYLNNNGKVIAAIDPQFQGDIFSNIRNVLAETTGATISNDLVVDSVKTIRESGGSIPIVDTFNDQNGITINFTEKLILPLSSSIKFLNSNDPKNYKLAETSLFPSSWAEKSFDEVLSSRVEFSQGSDLKGPVTIIGASELKAKAVLFGTSHFISNQYSQFQGHFLFFMNSINWILGDKDFITFDAPKETNERVALSALSFNVIFYFSVIFAPLVLIIFAFFIYRKRFET